MKRSTYFQQLEVAISPDRLLPYRRAGGRNVDVFARYLWNMALSEALHPALKCYEIALRNSIHNAATGHFGTDMWFDLRLNSDPNQHAVKAGILANARKELTKPPQPPDAGRIVAALTLGFWTFFANKSYEQNFWNPLAKDIFPYAPSHMLFRKTMAPRLQRIAYLRNRVAHHEPIWNWPQLRRDHGWVLQTLAWISPEMHTLAGCNDEFADVLAGGMRPYRTSLADVLQQLPP